MSGTVFQWIFDNAESINFNNIPAVSQTISRDRTVRSIRRTEGKWSFTVTMPNGMPWDISRPHITNINQWNLQTAGSVQINNSGYNGWLTKYQGDSSSISAVYAHGTINNDYLTLDSGLSGTYKLRVGDLIQPSGTTSVYSVKEDVTSSSTVYLTRPLKETFTTRLMYIGPNVTWNVICVEMPTWTIFSRNQVSWSGPFIFYETLQV